MYIIENGHLLKLSVNAAKKYLQAIIKDNDPKEHIQGAKVVQNYVDVDGQISKIRAQNLLDRLIGESLARRTRV